MRGFSTIEILIAFTVLVSGMVAVSLVAYGSPLILEHATTELSAANQAHALLTKQEIQARDTFESIMSTASTSDDRFTLGFNMIPMDDIGKRLTTTIQWRTPATIQKTIQLQSFVMDVRNAALHPCDPFLSGDWRVPRIVSSYRVTPGELLPSHIQGTYFPVSALAVNGSTLAIAIASTTSATHPTLFFFDISESDIVPVYISSEFDNAASSRIGYSALAIGPNTFYAGNGFSSASAITCASDPFGCAQLHLFDAHDTAPVRIASIQMPAASGSVPASAVMYRSGVLYLGLSKTTGGQELHLIDVHEPSLPKHLGGYTAGRGVNGIAADQHVAYITTDDNSSSGKALIALDIQDPTHPVELASYRFLGAGYARRVVRSGSRLYVGRSFSAGTSEELSVLDRSDISTLTRIGGIDIGTSRAPGGVREILIRDFLAFVLSERSLQIWNISDLSEISLYASVPLPNGTGTSLSCRNNMLYVGSAGAEGNGFLTTITSS